jgi:hypothetical protein
MIPRRRAVCSLAVHELLRLLSNPLAILVFCLLMTLVAVNGADSIVTLPVAETMFQGDVFLKFGITQELPGISLYCSVAALVFGVLSIAGDRGRALGILMTKPVSLQEIAAGKFLGIASFMLLLVALTYAIMCITLTLAFRGPLSTADFLPRIIVIVLALLAECCLMAGIGMLIGIILDSMKEAVMVGTMFLCATWFTNGMSLDLFGALNPQYLYFKIMHVNNDVMLFDTAIPFSYWLSLAWPYIMLMAIAVVAIFIIDCYAITKTERI